MKNNPWEESVTVYTAPQPEVNDSTANLEKLQHFSSIPKPIHSIGPGNGKGNLNNKFRWTAAGVMIHTDLRHVASINLCKGSGVF